MEITRDSIIAEIVANDYRYAGLFSKKGLDYCCNGNRSLYQACIDKGLSVEAVLKELQGLSFKEGDTVEDYLEWSEDKLVEYIVETHHAYVEKQIAAIVPNLQKICDVHGGTHPELYEVNRLFNEAAAELEVHMKKEESILFPYVRKLVVSKKSGEKMTQGAFGSVQNPIRMMESEHDAEGERFRKISKLTRNYTPPAEACNTYRATLALLRDFERDLHKHIHLENNILFPRALALEQATH